MTKKDVLKKTTTREIMKALAKEPGLWDEEVSNHLKSIKKRENERRFGEADIIYRPEKTNR